MFGGFCGNLQTSGLPGRPRSLPATPIFGRFAGKVTGSYQRCAEDLVRPAAGTKKRDLTADDADERRGASSPRSYLIRADPRHPRFLPFISFRQNLRGAHRSELFALQGIPPALRPEPNSSPRRGEAGRKEQDKKNRMGKVASSVHGFETAGCENARTTANERTQLEDSREISSRANGTAGAHE